jgi:predicted helicase
MMTPYTIAHLKLGITFKKTGFKYFNRRLGIYLTNTLEESLDQQGLFTAFGFADSIAEESKEASAIKIRTPIMVVIGNPPYSGESSNSQYKGNDVYKVEPSGGKLQEKNSKWLNDDYVKFIRYAEGMVEKTGEGIVAMITAHGYIDNPTFRGMRWHLMNTFDEIFVLDLHGNSNKKEKSPDGSEDKNVFDIKTGVSIFFGIKKKDSKKDIAKIYHADLYGKRPFKFEFLDKNLVNTVKWEKVIPSTPNYEWIKRDEEARKEYEKGFAVSELFPVSSVGIVTSRDAFVIDTNKDKLKNRIQNFLHSQSAQEAKIGFKLKENKKWRISDVLKHDYNENNIVPINYRPFDTRYVYYHNDFIERSRKEVMKNFDKQDNIGFVTVNRSPEKTPVSYFFVTKNPIINGYIRSDSVSIDTVFPLYIYNDNGTKIPNLKKEIFDKFKEIKRDVTIDNVFDYIYAVIYSPKYREKYKKFLKTGFPYIPYPKDKDNFKKIVDLGSQLQKLHLLESPKVSNFITSYSVDGSDIVEKNPEFKDGNVYINDQQYFGNVPKSVWEFYIGGYQPAQKWLKDRKSQKLTNDDLEHYQKIIVALAETIKTMDKIEEVWGE